MNKEYLKGTLALLSFLFGLLAFVFSLVTFQANEPSYILALISTFILATVGIVSAVMTYKHYKIISQLKNNELPHLAHWHYIPKDYRLVELQIEENRYIAISLIFLIGILGVLILLGLVFSSSPLHMLYAILLLILLVGFCGMSAYLVRHYYVKQMNKTCEAIISSQYIYFNGELYSIQKGLYYLEDVRIFSEDKDYLQFVYGAPGTPYGPFSTLTIPIPNGQNAAAKMIQQSYAISINQ